MACGAVAGDARGAAGWAARDDALVITSTLAAAITSAMPPPRGTLRTCIRMIAGQHVDQEREHE